MTLKHTDAIAPEQQSPLLSRVCWISSALQFPFISLHAVELFASVPAMYVFLLQGMLSKLAQVKQV